MKKKLTDLSTAVKLIPSGSSIAIGGTIIRRQPVAFFHELMRSKVKDITLTAFAFGIGADMLAAAGMLKRVEAVYIGMFQFGMAYNFRRAVEAGEVTVGDFSETAMIARYAAAAHGLDYFPTKCLLGTSMPEVNKEQIKAITSPFSGDKMHAVQACKTDFTVMHGFIGDEYGNVQWPEYRDADDIDTIIAKASTRLIITVEKIVPYSEIKLNPNRTYIPHHMVEAIVEVPFGSYPAQCEEFYDEDEDHIRYYQECAKEPGRWMSEYASKYIYGVKNHMEFLDLALTPSRMLYLTVR